MAIHDSVRLFNEQEEDDLELKGKGSCKSSTCRRDFHPHFYY